MTSIVQHIEYLLQRNDCVILPGIGAIVADYVAAKIDFNSGEITPPQRVFALNTAISHDDGVLATSISRAERIKFEDAREIMKRMMAELRHSLSVDREFSLGRIGRLVLSEEDRLVFHPYVSPLQNVAALGWQKAFAYPEVVQPAVVDNNTGENSRRFNVEEGEASLEPHTYVKILSDKNYYIAINKVVARFAASIIVIVALALPFIMPRRGSAPGHINAGMNPVETLLSHTAARDIDNDASLSEAQGIASAGDSELIAPDAEEVMEYLIVATFRSSSQAEDFVAANADSKYPLTIVERNGVFRISAARGDSATLRVILNSSEFQSTFPQAWIWKN